MKLVHPQLDKPFDLVSTLCWELVVEQRSMYVQLVRELAQQMHGDEGEWVLSADSKPQTISTSAMLIIDPFALDPTKSKPLQKRIADRMTEAALRDENANRTYELLAEVQAFAFNLIDNAGFSFDAGIPEGYAVSNFIKALGVAPTFDVETIAERLIEHNRIASELQSVDLIIVLGLRTWLDDSEVIELCQSCQQDGIALLMIEHHDYGALDGLQRRLLDDDLSEL